MPLNRERYTDFDILSDAIRDNLGILLKELSEVEGRLNARIDKIDRKLDELVRQVNRRNITAFRAPTRTIPVHDPHDPSAATEAGLPPRSL